MALQQHRVMTTQPAQHNGAWAETYHEESTNESLYITEATEMEGKMVEKKERPDNLYSHRWRNATLVMMMLVCFVASILIYLRIREEEKKDSATSYEIFAQTIEEAVKVEFEAMRNAFKGLADSFTLAAISRNTSFPFVTVPMFEVVGGRARAQAKGIEMLTFAPIVSEMNRLKWNEYSVKHESWLQESRQILRDRGDVLSFEASYVNKSIPQYIFGPQGRDYIASGSGLYAPAWQSSPPPIDPSNYINYNLLAESFLDRMVHSVALAGDGLMSEVMPLAGVSSTSMSESAHAKFHQSFVEDVLGESYYEHPHSAYIQPVYTEMGNLDARNSNLAGMIVSVMGWDGYLANLLPSGVNGVYAVLSNSCDQHHTYVINGPTAMYRGPGDMHDTGFENTHKRIQLGPFDHSMASRIAGHCVYSLNLYSSDEFEVESTTGFSTAKGIATVFGIVAGVVCAMLVMIVSVFDRRVRRQTPKVADATFQSEETLSSILSSSHWSSTSEPLKVTLTLSKQADSGDAKELRFGLVSEGLSVRHGRCDKFTECDGLSGVFA